MGWRIYMMIGGISYLFFVLAYLPAQHALSWLNPDDLPVATDEVTGTIWNGAAKRTFYNDIELGSSAWSFKPLSLFLGRVGYRLDISDSGRQISGETAVNLIDGDYVLTDLKGSMGAAKITALLGQTYMNLDGILDFDISRLNLSDQQVTAATGKLVWNDAGIQSPVRAELGSLQFDLSADQTMLTTNIKDISGPLKVDGVVELLPDGNYRIKGKVKQTDTSDQGIVRFLNNIGRQLADGSTQIDYSGQL